MALKKTETIYNDSTIEYHRIIEYRVDLATGAAVCVLGSWPSYDERASNAPPTLRRTFAFVPNSDDLAGLAYAAIKAHPAFADAEDV